MKTKTTFVCQECGYTSPKWLGKCPGCENWNTMLEESFAPSSAGDSLFTTGAKPMSISAVTADSEGTRLGTGIGELDQVLGGGAVTGSLVLVGGEPGIGKSTLLLQICAALSTHGNILYISGEESERQLKMRADRLSIHTDSLYVLSETSIDAAMVHIKTLSPRVLIVDSVQTMFTPSISSASGSVSQVREVTLRLMRFAKETGTTVFLVGHVTKDGAIAGPRVLEHMVDCVLYFEGDRHQSYRILRAVKNRFGSTNEIGVFDMGENGLTEVLNPSAMLLSERPESVPGSAVLCSLEGSRPLLAEVQALVTPTGFGIPRRMSSGIDLGRVNLLIAVLEKRVGLNLQNQDVYVNIIGGIRIDETAADLSVAAAIVSSCKGITIPPHMVFLGEIGLTGELRSISHIEKRVTESIRMGFREIVLPQANAKSLHVADSSVRLISAGTVREALSHLKS
ncbi:MAG: DNA repair protein RadA [Ruminococcaceae bacterium]|nr:DNA repair protein RadA [Oscillospiraceae bacterium]